MSGDAHFFCLPAAISITRCRGCRGGLSTCGERSWFTTPLTPEKWGGSWRGFHYAQFPSFPNITGLNSPISFLSIASANPVCLSVSALPVYPFVCQSIPIHTLPVFHSLSGLILSSYPVHLSLPASTLSLILSSFRCLPTLYLFSCPDFLPASTLFLILSSFPFLPPLYFLSCPAFPSCLHFNSYPVQLSLPASTLTPILSSFPFLPPL